MNNFLSTNYNEVQGKTKERVENGKAEMGTVIIEAYSKDC